MAHGFESVIAAAALVAALSGCTATAAGPSATPTLPYPYATAAIGANGPGTAPGPGIFALVPATHPHVQIECPLVSATRYDPALIPPETVESIYICSTAPYLDAPDGSPQIEEFVDRVATEDIPKLLAAFSEPDEEPVDGACTYEAQEPLIIWLHYGDGRITPVFGPDDGCGHPTDASRAVYRELELHRLLVAREKLRTK